MDRTEEQISIVVWADGASRMWQKKGVRFGSYFTLTVAPKVGMSNTGVLPRGSEHLDNSNISHLANFPTLKKT